MHYWGTALGTLLLSIICIVILYFFCGSKANLNSHIPLPLRAFIAACMMSWIFYVGVWGQMLPVPSVYFVYSIQDDSVHNTRVDADDWIVCYCAIVDFIVKLLAFIVFTLIKINSLTKARPKNNLMISFAWYFLVFIAITGAWFLRPYAFPCKFEVNGFCYDKPEAENPPLTYEVQILDADSGKPISGGWVDIDWQLVE